MTGRDEVSALDVVERFWPYDGPCSSEQAREAAAAVAALVRYLNNKTRSATSLRYASDLDAVVHDLALSIHRLDQLLGQLTDHAMELAGTPGVYDDRGDRPGGDTAHRAAAELTAAREIAQQLDTSLQRACTHTVYLGGPDMDLTNTTATDEAR